MIDVLATVPPVKQQASTETIPYSFDVSALLASGEIPSAPTVTLTDLASNLPYVAGLTGAAPAFSGNIVTQTTTALMPGRTYLLVLTFQAAAGKILSMALRLECSR